MLINMKSLQLSVNMTGTKNDEELVINSIFIHVRFSFGNLPIVSDGIPKSLDFSKFGSLKKHKWKYVHDMYPTNNWRNFKNYQLASAT